LVICPPPEAGRRFTQLDPSVANNFFGEEQCEKLYNLLSQPDRCSFLLRQR
jgi:hypothetical protein